MENKPQELFKEQNPQGLNKEQNDVQIFNTSDQNDLIKKLEQKWGINLAEIENEKKKQLEQQKKYQKEHIEKLKTEYEIAIMMEERKNVKISKFAQLQQQIEEKDIKNLKLESRGNINKNEEYPIQYAYFMEERADMTPKYNVGEKWGQIVEQQVVKEMQLRQDIAQNFFWAMTKKGRLGVDLFAIAFGILGIGIVPIYFYFKKQKRTSVYQKEYNLIHNIKDLEHSELDLDDISLQNNNYNLFQKEIKDEKSKAIGIHEEINKLMKLVYK